MTTLAFMAGLPVYKDASGISRAVDSATRARPPGLRASGEKRGWGRGLALNPLGLPRSIRASAVDKSEKEAHSGGAPGDDGQRLSVSETDSDACAAQVRRLWAEFNSGKFSNAVPLFAPTASYHDTLYPRAFEGQAAIKRHLLKMEKAFESGLVYVLDDVCSSSSSAAARWHVELENGAALPFTRGASTYKLIRDSDSDEHGGWLFTEAYDFPEPTVKAAPILLPILSIAVKLLRRFPKLLPPPEG